VHFQIVKQTGGEKSYISGADFAKILDWRLPSELKNNLEPEFNALIQYGSGQNNIAIMFLEKNFANAFEGMLAWEKNIRLDWLPFLKEKDPAVLKSALFQDAIIRNNDARVLKDAEGEIILVYSIFNRNFVIITTSADSLSLILERLIAIPPRI